MDFRSKLSKKWSVATFATLCFCLGQQIQQPMLKMQEKVEKNTVKSLNGLNWRSPANYSYQNEVVIKPASIESEYYQYMFGGNEQNLQMMRRQFDQWQQEEEFIEQWGLEGAGIYNVTSQQQKQDFIRAHLFRHVRNKIEDPLKEDLKVWWNKTSHSWKEEIFGDNSVDTVALYSSDKSEKYNRKSSESKKVENKKEDKDFIFRVKARALRGRIAAEMDSSFIQANATVNVGGPSEVNLRKNFEDLKLSAFVNYEVTSGNYRAEINKQIFIKNLNAQIRSQGGREVASDSIIGVFYNQRF